MVRPYFAILALSKLKWLSLAGGFLRPGSRQKQLAARTPFWRGVSIFFFLVDSEDNNRHLFLY